jgi:hypothetical protein
VYRSKDKEAKAMTTQEIMGEIMEYRGRVELVYVIAVLKDTPEAIDLIRTV